MTRYPAFAAPATLAGDKVPDNAATTPARAPTPEQASGAAVSQGAPPAAVDLASGDAAAGERTFKMRCSTCHATSAGSGSRIGPHLGGVTGRALAANTDFTYSAAMKAKGGTWTREALDRFLARPQGEVPGTKMGLAGMPDARQRADVIAYLAAQ